MPVLDLTVKRARYAGRCGSAGAEWCVWSRRNVGPGWTAAAGPDAAGTGTRVLPRTLCPRYTAASPSLCARAHSFASSLRYRCAVVAGLAQGAAARADRGSQATLKADGCSYSAWSSWSDCTSKGDADKGRQNRTRTVESKPEGLSKCPGKLVETRACKGALTLHPWVPPSALTHRLPASGGLRSH